PEEADEPAAAWLFEEPGEAAVFATDEPTGDPTDDFGAELETLLDEPLGALAGEEDLPDWMLETDDEDATVSPAAEPADAEPETAADGAGLPDWLREEAAPTEKGIRRIQPLAEEPVPEPVDDSIPDWLDEAPEFQEALPDTGGLTYDDWEQTQLEQEREAQRTPEERLVDEVPDWFSRLDQGQEAAPASSDAEPGKAKKSEAEFVPDWFLGLDEQDVEAAPDWFKQLDYSADAMVSPTPETAAPAAPPAAETPAGDVPDWFTGLGAPEVPTQAAPDAEAPAEAGEVPDWLAAAAPGADVMAQPDDIPFPDLDLESDLAAAEVADLPDDWMADFAPGTPGALPKTGHLQDPGEDFVERFEPKMPDEPASPSSAALDEQAPDWLREMESGLSGPESEVPLPGEISAPSTAAAADQPGDEGAELEMDWLSEISADDLAMPLPDDIAPPSPEAGITDRQLDSTAIDDLLGRDADLPAVVEEAPTSVSPFEGTDADLGDLGDLDALFAEAEGAEGELGALFEAAAEAQPEPEAAPLPDDIAPPPVTVEAKPDWVSEMRPDEVPVTFTLGGVQISQREKKLGELPDRLRVFREATLLQIAGQVPPAPSPETGALEGIANVLPMMGKLPYDSGGVPVEGLVVTDQQRSRANQLQSLLELVGAEEEEELLEEEEVDFDGFGTGSGEFMFDEEGEPVTAEAEPTPAPRRARRRRRRKLDRFLISVLLLVGLVGPFATDALHFADDPEDLHSAADDVADEIDDIQPGDLVLFAFEYGPTAAGELDPLAEAVLRDVLARGGVPLTLGTDPAGAFHAQAVLADLAEDEALLAARGYSETVWRAVPAQRDDELIVTPSIALVPGMPGSAVLVESASSFFQRGTNAITLRQPLVKQSLSLGAAIPLPGPSTLTITQPQAALASLAGGLDWLVVNTYLEESLEPGEDYFTLAYLGGELVGVRSLRTVAEDADGIPKQHPAFASDLDGDDTNLVVGSVENDIALVVVIGEESEDVRTWAEQLADLDVDKVALVTAAIEPLTVPYVEDDAYAGYLAGYRDAASYNAERNRASREPYRVPEDVDLPNPEEARWHSMALGLALIAGVISLGMAVNLLRALGRRRHR
ncbi:MAG: hypothetical protein GYB65_14675, partial [Chloroflexi bacterium]|nr:hypothetical protein [Chloroflexota bacterium]